VTIGFDAPGIAKAYLVYEALLQKMEEKLRTSSWLAGPNFSLADTALAPYVTRLDMLSMSEMWAKKRPHLAEWFGRIKSRPSYKPQLFDWCTPDLTNDLATFGAQSWPLVRRIHEAA
jgi:glutathione S-transferase